MAKDHVLSVGAKLLELLLSALVPHIVKGKWGAYVLLSFPINN